MSKSNTSKKGAKKEPRRTLFSPGAVTITNTLRYAMARGDITVPELAQFLRQHLEGDWGQVPETHRSANNAAVESGARILSAYRTKNRQIVSVVTDPADYQGLRLFTTLKMPFDL